MPYNKNVIFAAVQTLLVALLAASRERVLLRYEYGRGIRLK